MAACGLTEKTIDELAALIESKAMDKIVFCKFGHYLDQGPMTILRTKTYDIEHNQLKDLNGLDIDSENRDKGICFWALKRLNEVKIPEDISDRWRSSHRRFSK